jgi:hypothetical protein
MSYTVTEKPAWLGDLSTDALRRLSRNNEVLTEGSDDVIISPAMKDVTDEEIVEFVTKTTFSGHYTDELVDIEKSNLAKLGPRSIAKPWSERRTSLQDYFTPVQPLDSGEFGSLIRKYRRYFKIEPRLHPISTENAVEGLESSSAGGLPFMQKKGILREQNLANERWVDKFPCVIFTRTQEGGKTRNVMGVGISDVIREMRYHQAFLPIEKRLSWRAAINTPLDVDTSISAMLNSKRNDELVACLDFSAYDASITPNHSGVAFAFIAAHFADKFTREIFEIYMRFVTIPFYTPDGEYSGFHGVPSGSAFTNTVDSIVQYMVYYQAGFITDSHCAQIQGDDSIILIKEDQRDEVIKVFEDQGLIVNVEKSDFYTNEGTYLQRYYHQAYRGSTARVYGGVYSIARALGRLKYLERFIDDVGSDKELTGADYFVLRAISILENCKHHPHFIDLIKFVRRRDKHLLRYSETAVSKFEKHTSRRSRTGITNQYGDQSGIESFDTVKVLKSLG